MHLGGVSLFLGLGLASCSPPAPELPLGPPSPRAAATIHPPRLGVGQVAQIDLTVVTPPEYRLLAPSLPASWPGLARVDTLPLPMERLGVRWIQRTRIRVRALEAGARSWPALAIDIEGPAGERQRLTTEPVPFEVVSALDRFPGRAAPFPLRAPPAGWSTRHLVWAFGLGALAAWAASRIRTTRGRRTPRTRRQKALHDPPQPAPWQRTLEQLQHARAQAATRPRAAAHAVAATLRRYLQDRFGIAAESSTTEELASLRPPLFLVPRWSALLSIFQSCDAVRFRPDASEAPPGPPRGHTVVEALSQAERFVTETLPLAARR